MRPMIQLMTLIFMILLSSPMAAQTTVQEPLGQQDARSQLELNLIRQTLIDYIEGSTEGQPNRLKNAFHQDLNLYSIKNRKLDIWSGKDYIKSTKQGEPTGESGTILSVDFENNIGVAKVKISPPGNQPSYIDYFMLLKINDQWKIVHKMYTRQNGNSGSSRAWSANSKSNSAEEVKNKNPTPKKSDNGKNTRTDNAPINVEKLTSDIDKAIKETMKARGIPGAAVVVVKDGKTIHKTGFGLANVETNIAVTPDQTIFRIGSVSKALTLLALTRQIDQQHVRLDDNVEKYFDGIKNPNGYTRPITIKHLLTHTSGFDQIGGRDRQVRNFQQTLEQRKSLRPDLATYLQSNKLRRVSPAGLYYRYDTYGSTLAGAILERITGKPYAEAMADEMFKPLGMSQSFVEVDDAHRNDLAIGYETFNGRNVAQPYEVYVTTPASAIDATAADMGKLLEALTNQGANQHGRLLSPETNQAALTPLFRSHREFMGMTYGLHESYLTNSSQTKRVRTVDHGGTMQGFKSQFSILPEQNIGVFVVANHSGGGRNPVAAAAMQALVDNLTDIPDLQNYPVPERNNQKNLQPYVGNYYYGVYCHNPTSEDYENGGVWQRGPARAVSSKNGALIINNQEFRHRDNDVFVRADGEQMICFGRNDSNQISFFNYSTSPDTFERDD